MTGHSPLPPASSFGAVWRKRPIRAPSPIGLRREFPSGASIWNDSVSRRKFLTLMGASLALAGVAGCSVEPAPEEDIVPYVDPPESVIPGRPLFFATTMDVAGDAVGLLVESHMGRPTKVEGNPSHPASLGATDALHQASVLTLYDPDRSQAVTYLGQEQTWAAATRAIRAAMEQQSDAQGRGLRILTSSVISPTLGAQLSDVLARYPLARWCSFEPISRASSCAGAELAFGERLSTLCDFSRADVILSLDCDFLAAERGHVRHARDFTDRRKVHTAAAEAGQAKMNRLYVVESAVSCTGAKADHRLSLRGSRVEDFAQGLAARLGAGNRPPRESPYDKCIDAVADDLRAHRGQSIVVAGERQPPAVHLLAHVLNEKLENIGKTVHYTEPVEIDPPGAKYELAELTAEMERGEVQFLLILGGNPAYAASADVPFAKAIKKVPLTMHLSLYQDETSRLSHWHLPETHFLEAWSDARAYDGTASLVQPLVRPLYQGRSAHEVLALLTSSSAAPGFEIVKQYWRRKWSDDPSDRPFEDRWQIALHDGFVADSAFERRAPTVVEQWQQRLEDSGQSRRPITDLAREDCLELTFLPDPTVRDGEFANNGWLQELPKPVTLLTWGNAAIVSPATAERLGLKRGTYAHGGQHGGYHMPLVELTIGERQVRGPLWIMPGHADGTVTVYLGNGRRHAGRVGNGVGFDAYQLRTSNEPFFAAGLKLRDLGESELVACVQVHHSMEGRDIVRSTTLADYQKDPLSAMKRVREEQKDRSFGVDEPLRFYDGADNSKPAHKWGMAIDLTSCIGCNACIVACQAENNIPVVGKEQVAFGREMHWLRVDRYLEGPAENPTAFHFQPLPCMHCENAPCEYVCPVEATVHSADGLNDMIYNRCVGTRFCSNNCPYKVRRFNFLAYADFDAGSRRLQYNPDVTVRSRGVMEKCTYCVQRIRQAEIDSQTEERPIRDGEILTACQAACPAQAIAFGDMNDPQSQVRSWKQSPLGYGLLEDLNTVPRTTYLAELRNPNPALEGGKS